MKKVFTLFFGILLGGMVFGQSTTLVISQIYGGAGCGTAGCSTFQNDFIEIFNKGNAPVNLSGYSVQYTGATSTGAWGITSLPSVTLNPGQYFLVAQAFSANGTNPLPTPDATGTIAMSATAGKVAIVNNTTALNGSQCPTPSASIIDLVGYGTTANCNEGGANAPAPSTSTACLRVLGGCQDTQNNGSDFTAATPTPRNTTSPNNNCGGATPVIGAGPNLSGLSTTLGTASASQSYNLTASNLSPAAGNIVVTPSAGLEISADNSSFGTAPVNVPYTGGGISTATPIYVRLAANAPQGAFSGSITNTGGGAPTATVTVSGGVFQNYYNTKANNGLTAVTTWSSTTDGTGPSPANFTDGYQLFNIINQTNANYTGVWNVTATGNTSRVIVGNGTNPLTFTIQPGADSLTGATRVDILNNATLVLLNNRRPFLNNIANGSTVSYAQTGTSTTDTIRVGTLSYFNLILKGGIKLLSGNTTTVRGDFTVDNVLNFNGPTVTPFATLNVLGDVNFINGSTFEPQPTGDAGRITLAMNNNSGGPQNINAAGVDLLLFRLRRDSTSTDNDIVLSPGTNLTLGNAAGGGLQLAQGAATSTTLSMSNTTLRIIGGAAITTTSLGQLNTTNSSIVVQKSTTTTNAGTLRFTPTSTLSQFTVNFDPAFTRDSILLADNVKVTGTLNLTKGKIVVAPGKTLTLDTAATFTGGSNSAFTDGKLGRNTTAATGFVFPVGKGATYRPVTITPASIAPSAYTAEYFNVPYSTLTFTAPLTGISNTEYWDITKTSGANATVALSLNGTAITGATAADEVVVANFSGGTWASVNGAGITPGNATSGTAVSASLSAFSPFTFGITQGGVTYTFNGDGNWDNPANWSNNTIPPATLAAPNKIVINPIPGGTCIVNNVAGGQQVISPGAQLIINPNAKILLPGNLIVQ